MSSQYYVDEATGSDTTGTGLIDAPFQSLGYARYKFPEGSFLIRKDASEEYDAPTQSALKKAAKTAQGIEKKIKKQEELEERERTAKKEEREKREKLLEESKKIILTDDESLPKAKKVCTTFNAWIIISRREKVKILDLAKHRSQRVRVFGWVHRLRQQKDIIFIVLRDGTGYLQAVLSGLVVRSISMTMSPDLISARHKPTAP